MQIEQRRRRLLGRALVLLALLVAGTGCGAQKDEAPLSERSPKAASFLKQASRFYQTNRYGKALAMADSAAQYAPKSPDVFFTRGRILAAMKRYDPSQKSYEKALKLDPQYDVARFNWANNAFRREQYRKALPRYRKVMDALRERPETVSLYQGDATKKEAKYNVLLQMGRAYESLGVTDSTRLVYRQAVQVDSSRGEAYDGLRKSYEDEGATGEALTYARRALRRDTSNLSYQYAVGSLLFDKGKTRQVIKWLRPVVRQRPRLQEAQYTLGRALLLQGRQSEAKRHLTAADSLQKARAHVQDLGQKARRNSRNLQAWVQYGNALRQANRLEKATEAYRQAFRLAPTNIALKNNLANLSLLRGDTARAVEQYRAILRQDSTLSDVWLNLGVVYANAGRKKAAKQLWEKALQVDPDHAQAKKYLAEMSDE